MMTPAQRKLRARLAARAMHAKHPDGTEVTRKAREAFAASFPSESDRSLYYSRLATLRSI